MDYQKGENMLASHVLSTGADHAESPRVLAFQYRLN